MDFDKKVNDLYDYLFCLLVIALPLSFALPNIILLVLLSIFLLDFKNTKKIDFSILRKPSVIAIWALVLYWYVRDLSTGHLLDNKHSLYALIILLPLLFLKINNTTRIFTAFVITGLIIAVNASVGLMEYYSKYHQLLPFEGNVVNKILRMERPYLGFLCLMGVISSLHLAFNYRKYAWPLYGYALLISLFIFMISARISSISLIVILLLFLGFYFKTTIKNKLVVGVVSLIIVFTIVTFNKNFRERLFINGNTTEAISKLKTYEPRLVIWSCAYEIMLRPDFNRCFGIPSEKRIEDLLAMGYDKKITNKDKADYYVKIRLNSHSQFIATYLNSGSIGALLFVVFIISQIIISRKDFTKTALNLSLLLFLLVENVLYRQIGVYVFAIIIAMSCVDLNIRKEKKSKDIHLH